MRVELDEFAHVSSSSMQASMMLGSNFDRSGVATMRKFVMWSLMVISKKATVMVIESGTLGTVIVECWNVSVSVAGQGP